MASVAQIRPNCKRGESISPELRAFIDRAIVPILVKEFIAERKIAVGHLENEMVELGPTLVTAKGVHPR